MYDGVGDEPGAGEALGDGLGLGDGLAVGDAPALGVTNFMLEAVCWATPSMVGTVSPPEATNVSV